MLFEHEQENNTVKITLEDGVKVGAYLDGANLAGAYLDGANLAGAYLAGAYLARANLAGADLAGADLAGANLAGANLAGANLAGAYLAGAYLAGANLDGADLARANLAGADLAGANLAGATYGKCVEIGNNPLFILGLTWPVYIFKAHIKIGCQIHSKKEWLDFTDSDIAKMESRAAEFWKKWKKHILWMAFEGE